ncbi:MAG TPA: alpha-amylase family glycosyl hydrolase [Cyclobacteriaceae bacterium]|jgi:glycosidase|nr:alpha-amylase family glycosyl hydrolase [Cyclobacteriaceae bacterium]
MMIKKVYFLAFMLLACGNDNDPKNTNTDGDFKQYGTPYAGVPDVQNIVLYEVNTRAFSTAGNFQGIIDRLDSIKALGANTIWIMPIHPVGKLNSAGGLGSPYSVQDYMKVNTEFGNLDKLRELVQKAHDKNMAVILDWVANHTAWDNSWIKNKSWYSQDANGNIIIPPGTNWQDVAELNYGNNDMRKAMISAMRYWILEVNVDGYRCDAVDFVPTDFWKQAIDELKKIDGRNLIFLAEGGKADNFTAGFQMNYAWDFYTNLKQVYGSNKAASSVFTTHQSEYSSIPAGAKKLRYTTNHDVSAYEATPIELFGGVTGALSASVITIFTSSVPLIYSSQEVGQAAKLPFFTREPIQWDDNISMEHEYRKLFSVYNNTLAFTKGTLESFANNDFAVFKRKYNDEEYLVIVNVRNVKKDYTIDAALQNTSWVNALDGTAVSLGTTLSLEKFQYLILKK